MKKTLVVVFGSLLMALAACDSTNSTNDAVSDQPAVCNLTPATTVQASCTQYEQELCSKHVDCGTYGDMAECETWFVDSYGNCADAPTTALEAAKQANLKTCICELPDASCALLVSDGAEATIPACGEF